MMTRRRAAYSILEMMIVVAITAVLISLSGVCLHGIYRAHARLDGNLQYRAAVERLALQLRSDAHAADRATLAGKEDGKTLVIHGPGDTEIRYLDDGDQVTRTVMRGETTLHRDAFRLAGAERVEWRVSEEGRPAVRMAIRPREALSRNAVVVPVVVEASVGLHQ